MAIITDIVVIGGGHAGIESAHAAASLGAKVVLAAVRADRIGWMPCNPSIGGPAKGHLTREVDALGGLQARITDETTLHIRWLNTKKGPAVQALRAQCDKPKYAEVSQRHLNENPNITIMEGIVTDLIVEENSARGVIFENGAVVHSKSVILATGTFLGGMIYRGEERISAGRDGEAPAIGLAESLRKLNLPMARLKTGTVPRISRDSIDFD
ncbi:MAG TPA: FAD-dependent oxidoreductase, partial [bacterium]